MTHRTFSRLVKVVATLFAVIGFCDIVQLGVFYAWDLGQMLMVWPLYLRTLTFLFIVTALGVCVSFGGWWFIEKVIKSPGPDQERATRTVKSMRHVNADNFTHRKEGSKMRFLRPGGSAENGPAAYTQPHISTSGLKSE